MCGGSSLDKAFSSWVAVNLSSAVAFSMFSSELSFRVNLESFPLDQPDFSMLLEKGFKVGSKSISDLGQCH